MLSESELPKKFPSEFAGDPQEGTIMEIHEGGVVHGWEYRDGKWWYSDSCHGRSKFLLNDDGTIVSMKERILNYGYSNSTGPSGGSPQE